MDANMYPFIVTAFGSLLLLFLAGVGSIVYGKFKR